MNDLSKNNRHDTLSDVRVFLQREAPDRAKTIEVVCSSARRDMDRKSIHVPYRLFCETVSLFPECASDEGERRTTGWPQSTHIACWNDCHTFDTMPIPIPKHKRNNTYTVYGVVCSGNCGVAYILERNTYDQQLQLMLFKSMLIDVFGMAVDSVYALEPSPPRIFLTMFGGHLSIDAYRERSLHSRLSLLSPPFISYSMVLEDNARTRDSAESGRLDGSVAPISAHVIRGLRRPTRVAHDDDDDDEMAAPKFGGAVDDTKPSPFELFVKNKLAASSVDADGGVAETKEEGVLQEEKVSKPVRRSAPRQKRATAGAKSGGGANFSSAGTLAAFLQGDGTK